jgi:hypothetical protein
VKLTLFNVRATLGAVVLVAKGKYQINQVDILLYLVEVEFWFAGLLHVKESL